MNSSRNNMVNLVDGICKGLNIKKFLLTVFVGISVTAAVILLAGLVTKSILPREDQQFQLFLSLLVIPVIFLIYAVRQLLISKTTRQDIALKVEGEMPELMDSYACALEIAERGGPQGPIEAALSRSVEGKFKSGEISKMVTPGYLASPFIVFLFLITFGSGWVAFGSHLSKSAMFHVKSSGDSALAGVHVTPGDIRLASGSDLRVEAEIKRGEKKAELHYFNGEKWEVIEMVEEGKSVFSGVIYGIENDSSYKVVTPNVSSDEYDVTVYLKPEIKSFSASIKPPKYTGKKDIKISEIKDLAVPEGSVINLTVVANKPVKIFLNEGNTSDPSGAGLVESHLIELLAEKNGVYSIKLEDKEGNSALSKAFKISIVKDMPPHVEVTKPAKDLKKTKYDIVPVEVSALDDYGLMAVDLILEDSLGLTQTIKVFRPAEGKRTLEKNIFHELNLKDLRLEPGDVVAYYFSATDNREPLPQTSRTKIYFIEIRPDKSDTQDKKEEEEQDGEKQTELSVSDLIAAQKDLIRKVIDTRMKSREDENNKGKFDISAAERQALSSETATLKLAVQKRRDELKKEAEKMGGTLEDLGPIADLFKSSINNLKEAEEFLNGQMLSAGLSSNSKSLSDLIKIAIELEKNTQKQKSKSKKPPKEQQQEEEQEKEDERLADMLEKLEELEEQQEQLNEDLEKMDKEELAEREAMQQKMKEQQERMEELQEDLKEQQQQQASQQMQQAQQQMQQAQQQMQQGNSQGAQQESQKAEENIENAKNEIKRAMREQAREKLQQLAKKLDKTIEKQNEIGEKTEGLGDPKSQEGKKEMAGLKEKQDEVQKDMQKIMDQLGAAANEMDEKYPEVAESLREAREYAANQGIDRRLKRSSNALHYKRKDAAVREQDKAEEAMNMLGHKVRDAVGRLPQATLEELLKMRQQVEMARRQISGAQSIGKGEAGKLSEQLQQMMANMGEKTKNPQLQNEIPQFLDQLKNQGSGDAMVKGQMRAVNQAAVILDRMISELDLEKRLSLNKRTGSAPDKYRKSVREYLKSLSSQDK